MTLIECQSRRAAVSPADLPTVMAHKTDAPTYEELINYQRAKDKDDVRCVMCGLPPGCVVIPRQNKDVCKVMKAFQYFFMAGT